MSAFRRTMVGLVSLALMFGLDSALTEAQSTPAFEVASVKPNNSGDPRGGRLQPGGFSQTNITLQR